MQLNFLGKFYTPYKKNEQNDNNPQAYDPEEYHTYFSEGSGDGGGD